MRSSVLFLVTVLLISSVGYSQKGNLTGFVKDASNGDPLVGANVLSLEQAWEQQPMKKDSINYLT